MPAIFGRLALACAAAAGAIALGAHAAQAQGDAPPRLDWQVERLADQRPGEVQLTFGYRTEHHSSSDSHPARLADLAGLGDTQLASPNLTLVRFALRRDAGDFDCEGSARGGRASGTCSFHENPAFIGVLRSHGIGPAEPGDLFQLAYADIGRDYLDELARQHYPTPAIDDLRRAGQHGVGLGYLRELGAKGYRADSLAELIRVRDHGINLGYIQELKDAGYDHVAMADLVRARDHGVSGRFAAEFAERGYRGLPIDTLVRLRDHGVSANFADRANAEAAEDGRRLSPEELIRLRDTGGLYRASSRRER
jgi:hypothetical protein